MAHLTRLKAVQRLTVGKKIASGFGLLFAVLGLTAILAFTALGGAGRRLNAFAASTAETLAASSLESAMQGLKLEVNEFLATGSEESITATRAAQKKFAAELDRAAKLIVEPDRARQIDHARTLLGQYGAAFDDLVANQRGREKLEAEVLGPQAGILAEGLQQMLKQAQTQGDMNAAFQISNALKAFFESTSLVKDFLLTSNAARATAAREALKVTLTQIQRMQRDQAEMEKLDASLKDEARKALLEKLLQACTAYVQGVDASVEGKQARDRIVSERLNRLAPAFTTALTSVKNSLQELQRELQERTRAEQQRNEYVVTLVAGAGIVIGVVFAWLITRSVSRGITAIATRLADESTKARASAGQVAGASQAMAEGAARQATSLEETSSALREMASMTQRNSESAQNATRLANETRQTADAGAADMSEMKAAMNAIKASSEEISKIIKTIDEIAFQTNILALNAAVEAARAGEAGLGFAVVADEVRNLAQRCAAAARETAAKISASSEKSEQGVRISGKMAANLAAIVEHARRLDERIAEIARSSHEQSEGIGQLNSAAANMDKVTQENSGLAHQSALAADELKAQADQVRHAVAELMQMTQGNAADASGPDADVAEMPADAVVETPSRRLAPAARRSPAPVLT